MHSKAARGLNSDNSILMLIECEVSRDGIHSYVLWLEEKKHGVVSCLLSQASPHFYFYQSEGALLGEKMKEYTQREVLG